jgi:hypothetical protein
MFYKCRCRANTTTNLRFTEGQSRLTQTGTRAGLEEVSVNDRHKPLAEIITIVEHSKELQLAPRNHLLWRLIRG